VADERSLHAAAARLREHFASLSTPAA
jgi:hypothetical protein